MNWSHSLVACLLLANSAWAQSKERWVYAPSNYQVDAQADRIIALMKRAKACGYTHFLITDSKFARVSTLPKRYFDNVQRVTTAAQEQGIELVPALFGVGYSNDLLSNDPNLAEGLPVKEALFVVKDYIASHVPDPLVLLKDGALQNRKAWGFIDDNLISEAGTLRSDATRTNARFSQRLKLQPFRQYHVSVSLKTQAFKGGRAEIKVIGAKGQQLNYTYLLEKPTAEWSEKHVTFNSLEHSEVTLYFGVWGGHEGTLWWREPSIEECGLVNVLRRPGAPLEVKTEEGKLLVEGQDYEPVHDPKLGSVPYAGEYEPWHEPPNITVKDLPDGTRLRVSFHHPHIVYEGQVCACVSEPGFMSLLQRQAGDVHGLWGARSYMMSHDEWRVMNWCEACQKRKQDAGAMIALNAEDCVSFLKATSPAAKIYVWNDMFDPHHNAQKSYYLVRGDLTGSWEGLSKDVIIMNWNLGKLRESLQFFAGRGHKQIIAGYYDSDVSHLKNHLAAARDLPGVIGVMYTTWRKKYEDLEAFARIADEP